MQARPFTVLHVVTSLEAGGMENGIVNLARGLESRGFEMHVACLERRGAFADRLPSSSHVTVLGKQEGFSPVAAWELAACLTRMRPHVVHSHNLGALIYSGLASCGGRRCALIQGEHSQLTAEEKYPRRLRQRRWFYRGCRAIHTVSDAVRVELIATGFPADKICALANGVDTRRYSPGDRAAARQALSIPADAVCFGIVGRFGRYKGHLRLLDAFERVAARFSTAHLLIAGGGGPEEGAVTERVRTAGFRERIHFLGFQPDPRNSYHALDFLAVPSTNEGMSNVVLEAMSCGVPPLVQQGSGHEQVITPEVDGWIANLDSTESLTAQLSHLIANSGRLTVCGTNARKKVEAHFSLDSMLDAYERLYRACAPPLPS
jgi:glycosyltransferase involved in cell wall biosynthesis